MTVLFLSHIFNTNLGEQGWFQFREIAPNLRDTTYLYLVETNAAGSAANWSEQADAAGGPQGVWQVRGDAGGLGGDTRPPSDLIGRGAGRGGGERSGGGVS